MLKFMICFLDEMRCRRDFYAKHPEAKIQALTPEARGELTDHCRIFLPDEPVSLCLEYAGDSTDDSQMVMIVIFRLFIVSCLY